MHEAPFGSLMPFGGHKGFGLAAMCEIIGGALSAGFTTHTDTLGTTNAIINCMLSVIIDPAAFDDPDAQAEADAFIDWVKASPFAAGTDRIYEPGEPERVTRSQRETEGIPVDPATWTQIREAALAVGMSDEEAGRWSAYLR